MHFYLLVCYLHFVDYISICITLVMDLSYLESDENSFSDEASWPSIESDPALYSFEVDAMSFHSSVYSSDSETNIYDMLAADFDHLPDEMDAEPYLIEDMPSDRIPFPYLPHEQIDPPTEMEEEPPTPLVPATAGVTYGDILDWLSSGDVFDPAETATWIETMTDFVHRRQLDPETDFVLEDGFSMDAEDEDLCPWPVAIPPIRGVMFDFHLGAGPEQSCTALIGTDPCFQPAQFVLLFSAEGVDIIYQWYEEGITWTWFPDGTILGLSDFVVDMLPYIGSFRFAAAAA